MCGSEGSVVTSTWEKSEGKRIERGCLIIGRQAQMMPVLHSTTDQIVAGIGLPGGISMQQHK